MSTVEHPSTQAGPSKEAVLDAAQRLIHQYGYTGFSMRDLAQESGLAKATLYHHFQDKHEIFLQVLERDLATIRGRITAASAVPGDLPTHLHAITIVFFELANERGMLLFSTLRHAMGMENEFYSLMRRYRDELHRPIVELFGEAVASGTIRPVDPELAASSFFGILQGFTSRHLLIDDLKLDVHAANFVLDLLFNGLLPPSSGAQP
jgi:AcrR family transcriptional regulator